MLVIAYIAFVFLFATGVGLAYHSWVRKSQEVVVNNPAFLEFQKKYFNVYILVLLAEWLQGPYLYKLYHDYGFVDPYIGIIYVCGFISSVLFGTYTGFVADRWGRKKVCLIFTVLYSICCITKLSTNFYVLCIGRALGGISTSLLFSAFDAWYIYEHAQNYQFPSEWLDVTFSRATVYNSVIAIAAGFIANMLSEWMKLGPVSPFVLAVPFLVVAGFLIRSTWEENYGKQGNAFNSCLEGLRLIVTKKNIFLIGAVQAMFESVLYIFVFLWTPVLLPAGPPFGIVFSCFMCCIWIGGNVFDSYLKNHINESAVVCLVLYTVMFANGAASLASANHPRTSFMLFLCIELMCGMYFPAMGRLRSKVLPPASQTTIMNWFRVPMNLIASAVLLALHDSHSSHGITHMFLLCACLLLCGGLFAVLLHVFLKREEEQQDAIDDMS